MKSKNKERKSLYLARKHISNNIRILRLLKGYTQRKVAEDFGIASTTYGHLETGETMPNLEMLCRIADYYNVTLDYLVSFDINKHILSLIENNTDGITSAEFLNKYLQLSAGGKRQVIKRIYQLKKSEEGFVIFPWDYNKGCDKEDDIL